MKRLTDYIQEKLVINKDYNPYTCAPKSFNELREIIEQRYEEQGPGTEQNPINFNDIDVRNIDLFCNKKREGIFERTEFEYIDISDWNVSKVEDMRYMFFACKKLKSVGDLSDWKVTDKLRDTCNMFCMCHELKNIGDIGKWDMRNVGNTFEMFNRCDKLESVGDLSKWKVSKVENIAYMFCDCKKLKSVGDLSNWDVSSVKNMNSMFEGSAITNIPDWYKE